MAPYEAMLKSTAYERMRAEHQAEFAPASVFFTHDARSAIDRRNSFRVKAALVYEAITGHHVDDDHMPRANRLLLALAKECHSRMHGAVTTGQNGKDDGSATASGTEASKAAEKKKPETGSEASESAEKKTELTDESWDEELKRVVDGIFLVVGFLPRLRDAISKSVDRNDVDKNFKSRHMHDIVTDVIKLENQLPLRDMIRVGRVVKNAIDATVLKEEFKEVKLSSNFDKMLDGLELTKETALGNAIHDFCWYYSPFSSKKATDRPPFKDLATDGRTLLDFLHESVVKQPQGSGAGATGSPSRMPTARELRRSGVRLQSSENGRADVKFEQPTLQLPALVYDFKLATVVRNLLAREYEEQSKPVTRYFQMLNELVENAADVRVLRRAGVVRCGSSSPQEVHGLIKKIDGHAMYPSVYMTMDREIGKVREHHDKRMKNFFVRNRPGVIWASSVAALSVVAIVAARRKRG